MQSAPSPRSLYDTTVLGLALTYLATELVSLLLSRDHIDYLRTTSSRSPPPVPPDTHPQDTHLDPHPGVYMVGVVATNAMAFSNLLVLNSFVQAESKGASKTQQSIHSSTLRGK